MGLVSNPVSAGAEKCSLFVRFDRERETWTAESLRVLFLWDASALRGNRAEMTSTDLTFREFTQGNRKVAQF